MRVCIDVGGQVVFFSLKGKAMMGAPPRRLDSVRVDSDGASPAALQPPLIRPGAGIPRWKRDRDIPWEVEARVLEALDPG